MQYLGGKSRLAKRLAAILESERAQGGRFVDVFCGAWNVTAAMGSHGPRVANDACQPLVTLAQAWLAGWRPPAEVSLEVWQAAKAAKDPADPMTAFAGFGVSFGGNWFSSYAANRLTPGPRTPNGYRYALLAGNSLKKKLTKCADVRFTCLDFGDLEILPGDLVYADPPYRGTAACGDSGGFDHDRFVATAQGWAQIPGVKVFVSEYAAQAPTWVQVAEFVSGTGVSSGTLAKGKTERLFRVNP